MTPDERRTRLRVAREIIEEVLVDFLEKNATARFNTYQLSQALGVLNDDTCGFFLRGLLNNGRIDNHKTGQYNRWQARP